MGFQSFGSYGTFQRTPYPDRARKILEETRERSQQQDVFQQQQKAQQDSYLQVMRQKLLDERANRQRNFKTEQQFQKMYQDQVLRNQKQDIANIKIEAEAKGKLYEAIADFSFTAAEKAGEIRRTQEAEQYQKDKAEALQTLRNMSTEEIMAATAGLTIEENSLKAEAAIGESMATNVEEQYGAAEAAPLRKTLLSGYSEVLRSEVLSITAAQRLPEWFAMNNKNMVQVQLPGSDEETELTFFEAKRRGGVVAAQAYRQLSAQLAEDMGITKFDPVFQQKYYWDTAERYVSQGMAQSEAENEAILKKQFQAERENKIASELTVGFGTQDKYTISSLTASLKVSNPNLSAGYIRDEMVLGQLQTQLDNGQFDNDLSGTWSMIENQMIVLGEGNEVPLSSLEAAGNPAYLSLKENFENRQQQAEQEVEAIQTQQMEQEVDSWVQTALANDGRIDSKEAADIQRTMLQNYRAISPELYQQAKERFGAFDPGAVDKMDKNTAFNGLREQAIAGDLTTLELQQNLAWLSDSQKEELQKFLVATGLEPGEGYKRKDVETQVRKLFKKALGNESTDKVDHHSIDWAVSTAGSYYVEKFEQYSNDPQYTAEQAAVQARQDTLDYVSAGTKDESNPFYIVPSADGNSEQAYFKNFATGFTAGQRTDVQQQYREIAKDPSSLSSKVYVSSAYLSDVRNDVKNGRAVTFSPWVTEVAKQNGMKPYEVINAQIKAAGGDEEIKPGAYDLLSEQVQDNPRLTNLLSRPTQVRVNTAIISSNNAPSTVRQGTQGEQDVMQLAELAQFKSAPVAAAIWALETGRGKTVHGPNALFNIKSQDGQGTTTQTREFINGQWTTESATWANYGSPLESVQAFTKHVSKYPGYNEAKTPRELVTALYEAGYATDPNYVNKVIGVLEGMGFNPDSPIIAHTGSKATDPNFMSPTLQRVHFYTAGDVMAVGKSEHTDVKQVDNPNTPEDESNAFFMENALDDYVVVQDPTYGDVGLNELRQKDDNARRGGKRIPGTTFNAMRDGGTRVHRGWDYPTANGSHLYLKNGARVVGGYSTSYGYKQIIQLPDGRRFSFLHGYKP